MEKEGVVFKLDTEIGKNYPAVKLVNEFDAVVLCTGSTKPRMLTCEGADLKGVHYAVDFLKANTKSLLDSNLEDRMFISAEGKNVIVVGGGDTACEEAVYLAGLASKVYLIVRKPFLRASKIMQERVMNHDKIEVLFEHNAVGLFGENGVEGVHLVKRMGEPDEERYDLAIDGFFLAIGHKPNSDIFKPYVDTDEVGYIITEPDTPRTKVPGVFAAGDVADPHYRQAITAAGSGCKAAIEAERYLSAKGII